VANPNIVNDRDLIDRAIRAYHRAGNTVQPSKYSSEVQTHDGRTYVVLRNMRGVLEVYRTQIDGKLRNVKAARWPGPILLEAFGDDLFGTEEERRAEYFEHAHAEALEANDCCGAGTIRLCPLRCDPHCSNHVAVRANTEPPRGAAPRLHVVD
jgi:hypothetical protein